MEQLTVDELAVRVGLPGSTIRMYQTKGVLHPPRKTGRVAHYDDTHIERLTLVQRLQSRGFSLPAIAELVAARARGATVASVLGLGDTEGPDDWVRVRLRDAGKLMPLGDLRPALLRRAVEVGLVRWRFGWPHVRRWALESGTRLADLAIPSDEVLDHFASLRRSTDAIAREFVELFERRLWPTLEGPANREDQLDRIRELLVELTYTAETVVVGALRESVRDAAEEFAQRHGLVPSGDFRPAWADEPVSIAENLVRRPGDGGVPDDPEITRFLAGEDEDDDARR
ncbi:MerR family transcriptional regulator [Actinosynnema pretiosum subsp. pretiosum]|uniref:Transcriptional regulator, MerR family n=2 Tax=Actinosynnema TaxID=40566 RepID=C6WDH8_ACTMD|nr:MerR family transcriptional regulator [Actinosynnema mirum]ACU39615.1 transcriptional regulator, MerR family [Actinosynnema mirum DSM 43827]AXX33121.1 transcriptional regulator, MerR family [Actinosynnema pretiosum subsp. pretiosum]QUF03032.1 MerR family transcriptional regulator [Actinosynnema pretiosum subsp. pretiosum]